MLAAVAEYDSHVHRRSVLQAKSNMELSQSSEEFTPRQRVQRTQEIHCFMQEFYRREHVSSLRDRYGRLHLTGKAIAQCLKEDWDSICEPSRVATSKLSD